MTTNSTDTPTRTSAWRCTCLQAELDDGPALLAYARSVGDWKWNVNRPDGSRLAEGTSPDRESAMRAAEKAAKLGESQ